MALLKIEAIWDVTLDPADGDSTVVRNVGNCLSNLTVVNTSHKNGIVTRASDLSCSET